MDNEIVKKVRDAIDEAIPDRPDPEHIEQAARAAIAAYEAATAPIRDALLDSQYLAGAKAGWNAAQEDDPEKAYAALVKSRDGYLKPIADLRRARAVLNEK